MSPAASPDGAYSTIACVARNCVLKNVCLGGEPTSRLYQWPLIFHSGPRDTALPLLGPVHHEYAMQRVDHVPSSSQRAAAD